MHEAPSIGTRPVGTGVVSGSGWPAMTRMTSLWRPAAEASGASAASGWSAPTCANTAQLIGSRSRWTVRRPGRATGHPDIDGAGASRPDTDMADVPDSLTRITWISYEGHGFADRLDASALAKAEVVGVGGALPVNPRGGAGVSRIRRVPAMWLSALSRSSSCVER